MTSRSRRPPVVLDRKGEHMNPSPAIGLEGAGKEADGSIPQQPASGKDLVEVRLQNVIRPVKEVLQTNEK